MPVPTITAPASPRVIAVDKSIPTLSISATNTPISYAASPLPAGISVNTSTGQITGTPTVAGTTTTTVTATNGSGTSSPVYIIWEVQDAAVGAGAWSDLELDFDLVTREVTIPEVEKQEDDVVVTLLTRDSINLLVGFKKWGQLIDVSESANIARVSFSLKEFEPEQVIALAKESVDLVGSGSTSRYRLPLSIDRQQWDLLSSYEDDAQTSVRAISSIELEIAYTGYNGTESDSGIALYEGVEAAVGTLEFLGVDTTESPLDFDLTLGITVSGRPNQTVTLNRTFTATWSGAAWVISSLSGAASGSGVVESPWHVAFENTGVTGDADSINVSYEISTGGASVDYEYWELYNTGKSSMGSFTDPEAFVGWSGATGIQVFNSETVEPGDPPDLLSIDLTDYYDTVANFFALIESEWLSAIGDAVVCEAVDSETFRIVNPRGANPSSIAETVGWINATGVVIPPGYVSKSYVYDTTSVSTATVSGTLSSDPSEPPLRFSSQPFFTRVTRDWLDE